MKNIPNLFTLLNLFFGCLAIVCVLQNGIAIQYNNIGDQYVDINEKMWIASLFIGLAAVIDFLDGFLARLLGASSEMGKQLDSLADMVSFGVAPSMIVYQFLRMSYATDSKAMDTSFVFLFPAFFLAMAAAYRLAKFNLDETQKNHFKGMPTPAVGLTIASFPLIYWTCNNEIILYLFLNKWVWYLLILMLSWLMVSNVPMMSLKFTSLKIKDNIAVVILVILSVIFIFLFSWVTAPLLFIAYIILSLLSKKKLS